MTRTATEGHMEYYDDETAGQLEFFREFGIDEEALYGHTDGIHNGNLLEFKTSIADPNQVLFQAIKYLARLRIRGRNVPRNILLTDLAAKTIYLYDAADYSEDWHQPFTDAASRNNQGFAARTEPTVITDYLSAGAQEVVDVLKQNEFVPVHINADCVVSWAERFYREVPGADKSDLLNDDPKKGSLGELKDPRHFQGLIHPYPEDSWAEFSEILDQLNEKLRKIETGAFYTPRPYVEKSYDLLREVIARVPEGNDYVIIDRCAGTGNLQRLMTEEELSHCIVNTMEQFEYLELVREFGQSVRAVIPPTFKAGDPKRGYLLRGDALSDNFVLGVPDGEGQRRPNVIQRYIDDPNCTIIMFENPPYAEVAGMEAQKTKDRASFGWKSSHVKAEMTAEMERRHDVKAVNEVANLFIWSAFKYYLRQPTDAYVVFSPAKYFKQHQLVQKRFVRGFLFNRRRFAAEKDAGVSVILWANEPEVGRQEFPLTPFDINKKTGELHPGADHVEDPGAEPIVVKTTTRLLSTLYDTRKLPSDESGAIVCEMNGLEANRATRGNPVWGPDILGYLVAQKFSFDQTDLSTLLTIAAQYNGNGFYLRRDNYLTKLPLFAVGRMRSEGRFWIRGVINRNADNGDNFSHDEEFVKSSLIFTGLAYHNKCRSLNGSDGREYRNQLCFQDGTQASKDLEQFELSEWDKRLLKQWGSVRKQAEAVPAYDHTKSYGVFQIDKELNTKHLQFVGRKEKWVPDHPLLNGELKTIRKMALDYHREVVEPKLWKYELVK